MEGCGHFIPNLRDEVGDTLGKRNLLQKDRRWDEGARVADAEVVGAFEHGWAGGLWLARTIQARRLNEE